MVVELRRATARVPSIETLAIVSRHHTHLEVSGRDESNLSLLVATLPTGGERTQDISTLRQYSNNTNVSHSPCHPYSASTPKPYRVSISALSISRSPDLARRHGRARQSLILAQLRENWPPHAPVNAAYSGIGTDIWPVTPVTLVVGPMRIDLERS